MGLLGAHAKTSHLFKDSISRFGPLECLAELVVGVDIVVDGFAQLRNARVRTTLQSVLREQAEEAFYLVKPGGLGWREVQDEARVA